MVELVWRLPSCLVKASGIGELVCEVVNKTINCSADKLACVLVLRREERRKASVTEL